MLKIILAIFLPPVAVYMIDGATKQLAINIVLCFIGWIPGTVHALWMLSKENS